MSFSSETKNELAKIIPDRKCCQLAELAAFMRFSGSITLGGGHMGIKVSTDNAAVARLFVRLMKEYFGAKTSLSVGEETALAKGKIYELNIAPDSNAEQILREVGILGVKEGSNYITDGIDAGIVKKRCCKKAALRGIFMGCGSVNDPAKGYHLELSCASSYMAGDVRKLINSFGLKSKISGRKGKFVVYIKEAEQISDFLNIIGASGKFFQFEDVRIKKGMMNKTNRISNCESANMDKTIEAAQRQLADIKRITDKYGWEGLPPKLREAAKLRMENPELSLSELAEMMDPPMKKAGLNKRFIKIAEMAAKTGG